MAVLDRGYKTDVALMSVTNIEYETVKRFHDWQICRVSGDDQKYEMTEFTRDGETHSIVHARQSEMGMTAASATAMKLIYEFRPRYLIMVGIAAGVAKENVTDQIYGDVVVADVIWDYSSGKFVSPEGADISHGELGFLPRPRFVNVPEEVIGYVRIAAASPENECHIHIGPMACGNGVVANRDMVEKRIHSQKADTAGLDMESYGVVYAAVNATDPKPYPLVIKSVCDYANSEKADDYQKFAAHTSFEFAKFLYERFLPM